MKHKMYLMPILILCTFLLLSQGDIVLSKEIVSKDAVERKLFLHNKSTEWIHQFQRDWKITALGDSLTAGIGDQTGKGGYLYFLRNELLKERFVEEVSIKNLGIGGLQSNQLQDRLLNGDYAESIKDADAVIITIGGNDLLSLTSQNFLELSYQLILNKKELYKGHLGATIEMIRAQNSTSKIYLIGLFNPFYKWFEELNMIIDDWNETTKEMVDTREDVYFVPINDLFEDGEESLLYSDQFHPNEKGYEKIAERVLEYINQNP